MAGFDSQNNDSWSPFGDSSHTSQPQSGNQQSMPSFDPWADADTSTSQFEAAPASSSSSFDPLEDSFSGVSAVDAAPAEGFTQTKAPIVFLIPSLLCAIVSAVLSVIAQTGSASATSSSYFWLSLGGWALAGVIGISLLALFNHADTRERAKGAYVIEGWRTAIYWITIVLLLLAVVWSAIHLSLWVGKQF